MPGTAQAGSILQELSAAIQSAHEGDLGQLGSMIALIDRVDPALRPAPLNQLRDGLADLLMTTGEDFERNFQSIKTQVQAHLEDPPAMPPAPPEEPAALYDRLGGGPAIKAVVESFYDKVLAEPLVQPVFAGSDTGALRRHLALFLSQVTGGPREYDGRELAEAHRHLHITGEQFDVVANALLATLTEFGVGPEETDQLMGIAASARAEIVTAPGEQPAPQGAQAAVPAAGPGMVEDAEEEDAPDGIDPEL